MGHALKTKLDSNVVTAIDVAVKQALDEKLHAAENEIVEKVIYRLDHKTPVVEMNEHRGFFNPLGGP
ncbi:MAG: hypothetical protein JSS86_08965 [Cyanobacteria bacterium SZAS LIN-2]|nr:hypothetical protein [Cyanobacteria bacterium SZAS LIN-2]